MSEPRTREELELLLGPKGEEVSCERCFELLDEYVEAELGGGAAERMPAMHAHLEGCPACEEDAESLLALVASERGQGA